jgi:NAD(P)-dependent dehydrogenase (short-subunit alcohol dehydrogenase family)
LPVALDVTSERSIADAVAAALARFGRIDVLVNNAGYGVIGAVEETSAEDVRRLYETNVFGLLAATRAVLPVLRKQRSGHVINLSSVGGYRSGPGFGVLLLDQVRGRGHFGSAARRARAARRRRHRRGARILPHRVPRGEVGGRDGREHRRLRRHGGQGARAGEVGESPAAGRSGASRAW